MIKKQNIPYLIQLLDDESDNVCDSIVGELISFGPALKTELRKIPLVLNSKQRHGLNRVYQYHKELRFKQIWSSWFDLKKDVSKLEGALSVLSEFLSEFDCDYKLKSLLDQLAYDYQKKFKTKDPKLLAQYLFKEKGICGNENDYYNPQNCNLINVINQRRGIPISLASIYILVGARLGLKIDGCHFPGHFLARIKYNNEYLFVDCYNYGQIFTQEDIIEVRKEVSDSVELILTEEINVETMIRRFIANLIRCYQLQENVKNGELMINLFKKLDLHVTDKEIASLTPEDIILKSSSRCDVGQIVRHKRYGYRGVIVEVNKECEATDKWYYGNQTQPSKRQTWYHILVDGTEQVTYVAECNLDLDDSEQEVEHPLLSHFFNEFEDGFYLRNDQPWPDTDF